MYNASDMHELQFRPHPVELIDVRFRRLMIENLVRDSQEGPLRPPELRARFQSVITGTGLDGEVTLHVESEHFFEDSGGRDKPAPAAFSVEIVVTATFGVDLSFLRFLESQKGDSGAEADSNETLTPQAVLSLFMSTETPALIIWPYVRAKIADLVTGVGLPQLNLPLSQISVDSSDSDDPSDGDDSTTGVEV